MHLNRFNLGGAATLEPAEQKAEIHKLEKAAQPGERCKVCLDREGVLAILREEMACAESENTYLRQVLSRLDSREPQLGMVI